MGDGNGFFAFRQEFRCGRRLRLLPLLLFLQFNVASGAGWSRGNQFYHGLFRALFVSRVLLVQLLLLLPVRLGVRVLPKQLVVVIKTYL